MICRVCMRPADIPISEKIDDLSILGAIRAVANIWVSLVVVDSKSSFMFWMKNVLNRNVDQSAKLQKRCSY